MQGRPESDDSLHAVTQWVAESGRGPDIHASHRLGMAVWKLFLEYAFPYRGTRGNAAPGPKPGPFQSRPASLGITATEFARISTANSSSVHPRSAASARAMPASSDGSLRACACGGGKASRSAAVR